jgi:hypothetical protein
MIRLRQVALVARDLEPAIKELSDALGIEVGYRDPGIAEFGLVNAVFPVGDAFLEIVSPVQEGTTAGRLLDKHGGDYGYMVIMQLSDLDAARARLDGLNVRVVWKADLRDAAGTHLHPKDVGGTILSLDWMDPPESWRWAGPDWEQHVRTDIVSGLSGVTLAVEDPGATASRWADVFGVSTAGAEIALDLVCSERATRGRRRLRRHRHSRRSQSSGRDRERLWDHVAVRLRCATASPSLTPTASRPALRSTAWRLSSSNSDSTRCG